MEKDTLVVRVQNIGEKRIGIIGDYESNYIILKDPAKPNCFSAGGFNSAV